MINMSIMRMVVRQWKGIHGWLPTVCAHEACATARWWAWQTTSVCQATARVLCRFRKLWCMLQLIAFICTANTVALISTFFSALVSMFPIRVLTSGDW